MIVSKAVASFVIMQGRTDSDAVARAFPHIPRATLQKAIQNAHYQGRIHVEQRGKGGWDRAPAILCAPLPDQKKLRGPALVRGFDRARVASVWELGNPQPLKLPDLPARRYSPLGAWNEESA